MKNIVIKNGLLAGLIVSIVMACMTLYMKANPDNEPSAIVGFASMLLAFTFVVLGIIQVKKLDGGIINFSKAFLTGFLISLIASTIYVVVWLIIYYNFFPNFMDQYGEMVLKTTKPENLAAKTTEINQMKEWYKNPVMIILLTLMEIFPIGIVVSLISALILKKSK